MRRAFVTGVTGQDGHYLARLLLWRGYRVVAGVRLVDGMESMRAADDLPGLVLERFDLVDPPSVEEAIRRAEPDEIYHLAGISSVAETWKHPGRAVRTNLEGTVHLLEAMRLHRPSARLVFAGSADCYDHEAARETGIRPDGPPLCTNPYAITKSAAMQFVRRYREEHGLAASCAILMNHTSPRRPRPFVERKIVHGAVAIARGRARRLQLGSLETRRDWSWSEDVVEGLAALGAAPNAGDYVFASGETRTTGDWVRLAFERLGLDPDAHLEVDSRQLHKGDRPHTFGDIAPAARDLGWRPRTPFEEIVRRMVEAELATEA